VSQTKWNVSFRIYRKKEGQEKYFQTFHLGVDPDEYVLDAVERIWAFHDRSLAFRHACHHSTCGACAMLVNGVEKLTCITPIRSVTHEKGDVKLEPLRNFPIVSDLVVDMSSFYLDMEMVKSAQILPVAGSFLPYEKEAKNFVETAYQRLADCIECGMCISACPSALTSSSYLGPAAMAAAQQNLTSKKNGEIQNLVDCQDGVWRCHSAYECSEVCPSHVDPAWRIMNLRKRIIIHRIHSLFFGKEREPQHG
jgi:succinate dehydrogenase/fumarate reductase iron-sulfur protein